MFRFVLITLPIIAWFLTGTGVIMSAALKNSSAADYILAYYPKYKMATEGFNILKDLKYPVPVDEKGQMRDVGLLSIDEAAWPAILEFAKSEIAVRKSERNEPATTVVHNPGSDAKPKETVEKPATSPPPIAPINFDRIKMG